MVASLSHPLSAFSIPSPEQADPEPVQSYLTLARTVLARGDAREALRHLRRAAEGADDAGSEQRAVELARAAADLATELGSSVTPPPAPVTQVPPSAVRDTADSSLQQLLDSGRAVRVVVKRSTRDDGLYIVRRAENAAPALGTREAVVVLLDADADFFEPVP